MIDKVSNLDICTPAQFEKDNPHLVGGPGMPKMITLIRCRHINGLVDCGAVIEPVQRRPMIVIPKFIEWFLDDQRMAKSNVQSCG